MPVPASAEPQSCTTKADLPARVSIDREWQVVDVPLVDTCAPEYAAFDIYGPDGFDDFLEYFPQDDETVSSWLVLGEMPPGVYRTRDGETSESVYDSTVLKYGSRARLTAKRSGTTVQLTACATQYNGMRDAFVAWAGHRVTVQKLDGDGRSWQYLATTTTGRGGCVDVPTRSPGRASFRVTTWETPKVFSRTSPAVTA
ncbi:hypothetical protein [uncultured Pseudokineococcus sp.]|uniref:hypothetical protein n=1 Tax=uncultured Pseudokineococcus sp. TaxID=1642928 RepID=UPI002624C661|nr:hypothetical protein [uncultured Pseudokineococcus sp.]